MLKSAWAWCIVEDARMSQIVVKILPAGKRSRISIDLCKYIFMPISANDIFSASLFFGKFMEKSCNFLKSLRKSI